jgi:hypothetical protein
MPELDPKLELESLKEKRWDIMEELAATELAITALLNKIRGNYDG